MTRDLMGNVNLMTGAADGIGRVAASGLAKRGPGEKLCARAIARSTRGAA